MISLETWRRMSTSARALRRNLDGVLEGSIHSRARRLIDRVAAATGLRRRAKELFAPDSELLTTRGDSSVIRVALPAVGETDVDVQLEGNMLLITGHWREQRRERRRAGGYTWRALGSFTRIIELPRGVDKSRIEADFDVGVLQVHLPSGERSGGRRVPIDEQVRPRRRIIESRIAGARADGLA